MGSGSLRGHPAMDGPVIRGRIRSGSSKRRHIELISGYPNSIPDFLNLRTSRQPHNRKKIDFAKGNFYRVVSSADAHFEHDVWEGSILLRDDDARQSPVH
jgi:hypothetical protein